MSDSAVDVGPLAAPGDVVDEIETIAVNEIVEIRKLIADPDSRITNEVGERLKLLLEIVMMARKERREQRKWVEKLPDEEVGVK